MLNDVVVYTGLVVDAQGFEVSSKPCHRESLWKMGGWCIVPEWVDPEVTQQRTVVGYVKGIPNAKSHERVITVAFSCQGIGSEYQLIPSDLVISDADAQTLHLIPEHVAFLTESEGDRSFGNKFD